MSDPAAPTVPWLLPARRRHLRHVELEGLEFDALTERTTVECVLAALEWGQGGWVVTVNTDILRQCTRDPQLCEMLHEADIVVADGQPIVWANGLRGTAVPERVAGSNIIWSLSAAAARRSRSIFLLGGEPGVGEAAAARLIEHCPGLQVDGVLSPPFGFEHDPLEIERIRAALREAQPDIVFVGLSFPKQERLIESVREELPLAWFLGVGISFSFVAGRVTRAPRWIQRLGLEWVHRLLQEPTRLARRYLVDGPPFAARLLARSALDRRRR